MYKIINKGFTLIELIVVMAIIAVLVLLAMPKMNNYQQQARTTNIKNNIKQAENAAERYYLDHQKWPRNETAIAYTKEELEEYAKTFTTITGETIELDENGKYYPISFGMLSDYMHKPKDYFQYIIQNPIGNVFYIDDFKEDKKEIVKQNYEKNDKKSTTEKPSEPQEPEEPEIEKEASVLEGLPGYHFPSDTIASSNDITNNDGYPNRAIDKELSTGWGPKGYTGTITLSFTNPINIKKLNFVTFGNVTGKMTYTISGLKDGIWTQIAQTTENTVANIRTYKFIDVTEGKYEAIKINLAHTMSWVALSEVTYE